MPYIYKHRRPPESWAEYRKTISYRVTVPFFFFEWLSDWGAFLLSRWSALEMLEYAGSLSILIGVIFYFLGANDRLEQKHYQAWQVINTAEGKGGSGGRIDALQELNADGVPLVGVETRDAFLQGIKLPRANLQRAVMSSCDMRGAMLDGANLAAAEFVYTNFRGASVQNCDMTDSNFTDADLHDSNLSSSNFSNTKLDRADLGNANLDNIHNWQSIQSVSQTNVAGVKNSPPGFVDWAKQHGAIEQLDDPPAATATKVTVSAAISLKEVLNDIDKQYKADDGVDVDLSLGASGTLAAQIQQGAPVDLFISAANKQVDQLISLKLADPATRTVVARNELVLIAPKGLANPPTSFDDLKDDRFAHIAVGEPKVVPAGQYAMQTLKYLHLDDVLASKLVMGENVRQVLLYVSREEAQAGLVYATDAAALPDSVQVCAVAPAESHDPIVYPAVIIKNGDAQAAQNYLNYLQTDKAKAIFLAHGFEAATVAATQSGQ
jgi:molybdenum ABC transporter molybdate-binding protein